MSVGKVAAAAAGCAVGCAVYYLYSKKKAPSPKQVKLTYFDMPATPGEKVRLALTLSGTPFEDNRVKFPDWAALKPKTKYGQVRAVLPGSQAYPHRSLRPARADAHPGG